MGRAKTISDEDVIEAARLVFLTEGHAASTRAIAERVGLSQAALVQRFGTKDALFLAATQPDVLDVETILRAEDDALREGALDHLAGVAARLVDCIQQQVPRLLHLRQNPSVSRKTVDRAHARLGVPVLVQRLGERVQWLQQRRLLSSAVPPDHVVELVLTLVHGVAFMNLLGGHNEEDARPGFRRLLAGVAAIAPTATGTTRTRKSGN